SYLNLKRAINDLGRPPILALTATATPRVVDDIKERLDMQDVDVVHLGFTRPELIFEVRGVADEKAQVKRLLRLVRRIKGSGIVYCSTINTVEALAGALPRLGLRVGKYHGKMTKNERDGEQHRFMKNQVRVMIATNAFGLGVDKPDIRFIIHYNLPGSIEQYYQEVGRLGRRRRRAGDLERGGGLPQEARERPRAAAGDARLREREEVPRAGADGVLRPGVAPLRKVRHLHRQAGRLRRRRGGGRRPP